MIKLHLGWGKSFVILLDGDKEGIRQKQRYEENYGPGLANRCFLLPDVVGDPVVTEGEDLLTSSDAAALIAIVFSQVGAPADSKKALAQSLLELFARGRAVSLSADSLERLKALLKGLQERLQAV
jgi:hypothetical protein